MNERIDAEISLLKSRSLNVTLNESWVLITDYPIPPDKGWNRGKTDICFQIPPQYPGTPPYGFYIPAGIMCKGNVPKNYQPKANNIPPFNGEWGFFSTKAEDWFASVDLLKGSNLFNFVMTFKERFKEGL